MDMQSVCNLLARIAIHYPAMQKQYFEPDGKITKMYADEWYRCIGHKTDDEMNKLLNEHLTNPNMNRYAPTLQYFMTNKVAAPRCNYFVGDRSKNIWFVDRYGRLYNQNGEEYHDAPYEEPYKLDEDKNIWFCGRIVGKGSSYEDEQRKDAPQEE